MAIKPISERKYDWFFVVAFSFFICTSIITDSVNGLADQLDPRSSYGIERYIYHTYAKLADPLLIINPPQVKYSAWISAFIWLPLYFYFVIGFYKGWEKVRVPGLVYGGALTHGMITYIAEGTLGYWATEGWKTIEGCTKPDVAYYMRANLPYLIVPFLTIIRLWKPNPFGTKDNK